MTGVEHSSYLVHHLDQNSSSLKSLLINECFLVKDGNKLIFVCEKEGAFTKRKRNIFAYVYFFKMVLFWVEFKNVIIEKLPRWSLQSS